MSEIADYYSKKVKRNIEQALIDYGSDVLGINKKYPIGKDCEHDRYRAFNKAREKRLNQIYQLLEPKYNCPDDCILKGDKCPIGTYPPLLVRDSRIKNCPHYYAYKQEAKYEHITEEIGASYDTTYRVVTNCIPNCPACAFKAGEESVKAKVRGIYKNANDLKELEDLIQEYLEMAI